MVSTLTQNFISFFKPFSSQSLALFSLAYRAVTLFSIKPVEWVAQFTMSYLGFRNHGVFGCSKKSKMKRINTIPFAASMVNNFLSRYFSNMHVITDPMSPSPFLFKVERPITISVQRALPKHAFSFLNPLTVKPFQLIFRKTFHIVSLLPLMPLSISK